MFSISTFTLFAALSSALIANAQVSPSEPSPGSVYPEGGQCPISWEADPSKTDTWKNMNIQLMTGDNFNMIPLTTVATGQDGTVNGQFSYPCPQVTLHSAVYFYQFTNTQTSDKQWTTRFAISTAAGATTPPPNATQPGTGANIAWGVGALANPSQAVPPPGSSASGAIANLPSSSGMLIASTSSGLPLASTTPAASPLAVVPSSSSNGMVTSVVIASPSTTPSTTGTGSNDAIALSSTSALTSLIIPVLALMLL